MSEKTPQDNEQPGIIEAGRTTSDLHEEAQEAMRLYDALKESDQQASEVNTGVFTGGMLLRVEINGVSTPLYIVPKTEIVIGRRDPATGEAPEIDLSAHAAYQMGISRRHALIRWEENQLYLYDMGSRNGTYVNGKRAVPKQPLKLYDGDELRLGKMQLTLHFRAEPSG